MATRAVSARASILNTQYSYLLYYSEHRRVGEAGLSFPATIQAFARAFNSPKPANNRRLGLLCPAAFFVFAALAGQKIPKESLDEAKELFVKRRAIVAAVLLAVGIIQSDILQGGKYEQLCG